MTLKQFDDQVSALSARIVDEIHDEIDDQKALELSVIIAALFDAVCFYAAMAPKGGAPGLDATVSGTAADVIGRRYRGPCRTL